MAPNVLFVLTSHDQMGDSGQKTGWYLPEFAHPYDVLSAAGARITVASPSGGPSPLDPSSVDAFALDAQCESFLHTKQALWTDTLNLEALLGQTGDFDAIFFVGGHGPMFDLATSAVSHQLINEFYTADKVVAAVCHGPAALAYVKDKQGNYLIDGEAVTGFSNTEEDAVDKSKYMPFMLEDQLNAASGGKYEKAGEDWASHVVVARGGKLITGQNPASATATGEAIKKALGL